MTKYEGKTLNKVTLVMEDCFFINCVLNECDVFYSGGDVEMVNTRFEKCTWHFRGVAQKTIQTLTMIGMLKAQPMIVQSQTNEAQAN